MCSPSIVQAALDGDGHEHGPHRCHDVTVDQLDVRPDDADVPEAPVALATPNRRRLLRGAIGGALGLAGLAALPGTSAAQEPAGRTLSFTRIADLTHPLSPDFPVFDLFVRPPEVTPWRTLAEHGFNTNEWRFNEHTGTHIDVVAHAQDGGLTVDAIPLDQLIAPLAVIRYADRAARDATTELTVGDIEAWERRNGRIPRGAFVAADAGWSRRIDTPGAFLNTDPANGNPTFPGIGPEAADFLLTQRSIVGFGVDTISLDHSARLFPLVHRMLLTTGHYGLECLAHLDQVPDTGATLVVGTPKLRGGFGAPVRAMALC